MPEKSPDTDRPVRPHNHSVSDLPIGTGPGKIPTTEQVEDMINAAGPGLAVDDTMSAQGVGIIILNIPSGSGTLTFPVLEKLEILDAWTIKADLAGGGSDGVNFFRQTGAGPIVPLTGEFPQSTAVGTVQRVGDGLVTGTPWFESRSFDVGDSFIVNRGLPLNTNNACTVFLLVARRA